LKLDINVKDFKKLEKELLKLPDKGKSALSDASNKAGTYLQRKLITAYPVNNKNNIHIRDTVKMKKAKIDKKRTYQTAFVTAGSKKAPYAMALEWGRNTKNGRSRAGKYVENVKDNFGQKASEIMVNILIKKLGLK
jgi:hypothetical protein